ncbi:MAG: YdeI/OmpD-associated family protein [Planctomycetota bacterium]
MKRNRHAWQFFTELAPSYRRAYIGWIESAKRQATKEKRLREALGLLAVGKRLGLK